ncbi:MAG TPA: DinB family protein [Candidatus Dormibacteraeota bacterium]|nr:DinB family protein [Candidatus Dormibacteraeota bacterium]
MIIEPFRHNAWATLRLLEFCRELDPAILQAYAPGSFGSIGQILARMVGAEEALAALVEGVPRHGYPPRYSSLDDLQERARRLRDRWERILEVEHHPERLVEGDRGGPERRLIRVGTIVAQAVHVGNHHRAQICMILASLDIEPPVLDAWSYGAHLTERGDRERWRRDAV